MRIMCDYCGSPTRDNHIVEVVALGLSYMMCEECAQNPKHFAGHKLLRPPHGWIINNLDETIIIKPDI